MKKILIALLAVVLFTSCTNTADKNGNKDEAIQLKADGSSTVYPITEAVAEDYHAAHANFQVTIGVSGTGGGFKKFGNGEIDIQNASRPIKQSEIDACSAKGIKFIELPVAYDGLAVVVNPKNNWVDKLTVAELKMIWESAAQGVITNWNQVRSTFPNKPLKLFGPGTDSGTFDYFTEAVNGKKGNSRGDYTASEDDNVLVQGVATDEGGLGYFGLAYYEENTDKLKVVPIDDEIETNGSGGILPTIETVQNLTYSPLSRGLYIYVTDSALSKPAIVDFVTYYIDNAGKLAQEVGYVPLPDNLYPMVKQRLEKKIMGSMYKDGSEIGTKLEEVLLQGAQ